MNPFPTTKVMFQIGLKNFLRLKKLKIMCCGHMLLVILKGKKLLGWFTIKRKGDKIYVKWKGYGNSFNSSIDRKDIA